MCKNGQIRDIGNIKFLARTFCLFLMVGENRPLQKCELRIGLGHIFSMFFRDRCLLGQKYTYTFWILVKIQQKTPIAPPCPRIGQKYVHPWKNSYINLCPCVDFGWGRTFGKPGVVKIKNT